MPVKGFDFNYTRVHIINSLIRFGGSVKAKSCSAAIYDDMIEHGFDSAAMTRNHFAAKLAQMQEEGILLRDVVGKRTVEILLLLDGIPEALMDRLELSSPVSYPEEVIAEAAEPEPTPQVQVSQTITAESVAASLLEQVVALVKAPPQSKADIYDQQTKQKLGEALAEIENLRVSLSAAKARISSLEQEKSQLERNVKILAENRVVVDARVGRDLAELMSQPKPTG